MLQPTLSSPRSTLSSFNWLTRPPSSPQAACRIYEKRPRPGERRRGKSCTMSAHLAAEYGVTTKTIRDIWNRSTWGKVTRHLWTPAEVQRYVDQRRRMSERLDPAMGLPGWCNAEGGDGKRRRRRAS
mmetsp:Transcript_26986/g.71027  ORF Transcript_26986/g.71027 Transcript_26986/m.71027 type:complete len:127 (-) Transcript_26986:20-400(-)